MDLIDRQPEERTDKRTETHACDLIGRQAAIDAIADYLRRVCLAFSDYMTDDESKECATCILQLVPSAQPERKKGRWIAHPGGKFVGFPYMHYECDQCRNFEPIETNYCPHCGAYMGEDKT